MSLTNHDVTPFAFEGKELKALAADGDVWYFVDELQNMLEAKNIRGEVNKLPERWKRVVDVREITVGKPYTTGNPRRTLVNTKGAIKIALRARWSKADEFTEKIADLADRHYKGDLSVSQENINLNGGRDPEGLQRIAEQSVMFLEHPAAQHTARRIESIAARKAHVSTLGKHGVTPAGFGRVTNGTYTGMFGMKAKELAKSMGLTKKQGIRDNLCQTDLIGVTLSESLATDKIEKQNVYGDKPCADVSLEVASEVGKAIKRARI